MKQKLSLKGRALRYLSMREHSRAELFRKLSSHAEDGDDVDAILDWLEENNFLSTERFSDSLVNRRSGRFGNHRILAELQSHNVDAIEMDRIKSELAESETSRAVEVLLRKFPHPPLNQNERLKQSRFLQQRGFSGKSIQLALKTGRSAND
ncbi:recombination regulator RecX [Undibacterium sp. 14-3-2]|uniref:recombination regulator RecX n=1 Tax=Undibacterium sp. 14-3-2 TaxID=2800129 RepID=UPI001F2A073E|nr:recombination regulator RecX [Undibacterium sp. 14-3-2]